MCLCLTFSLLSKHTSGPLRYLGFLASSHGSGPSAEDARSGKSRFSFKRRTLALETTMCRLLTPLPVKPNMSPAHKALAALIPSFILFQMFSNVLRTFGGGRNHNYTCCCTVFMIYYAVGLFSAVFVTA